MTDDFQELSVFFSLHFSENGKKSSQGFSDWQNGKEIDV